MIINTTAALKYFIDAASCQDWWVGHHKQRVTRVTNEDKYTSIGYVTAKSCLHLRISRISNSSRSLYVTSMRPGRRIENLLYTLAICIMLPTIRRDRCCILKNVWLRSPFYIVITFAGSLFVNFVQLWYLITCYICLFACLPIIVIMLKSDRFYW